MSEDDLRYAETARRYVASLPGDLKWIGYVAPEYGLAYTPEEWAQLGRDLVAGRSPLLAFHTLEADE